MRPEDRQLITQDPRGNVQPPQRDGSAAQAAAVSVASAQVDSVFKQQEAAPTQQQSSALPDAYRKTHSASHAAQQQEWQQYHSAWQDYYQKYYEHYYVGAVKQVHEAYVAHVAEQDAVTPPQSPEPSATEAFSQEEAVQDLRTQLLGKITTSAKKVRGSRHFVPLTAALIVLLVFGFLQYNRVIIANVQAYITPGQIDPQNIVVDPNASLEVGKAPLLIIPKINVNVPVQYNTKPDYDSQMKAMENGVAYFGIPGANSKPGQVGNTVISGHSSNDFIDGGKYKFVFALLDRLKPGDIFYLHYEGIRYTYSITRTKIVTPTQVSSLVYPTTKPEVTLITCTPLGTSLNRLLVTAEQISPNPGTATKAPSTNSADKSAKIPGSSPTFIERIFGAS